MAKYVIENSDQEILELKHKCRMVRDRISKIGMMLPTISKPILSATSSNTRQQSNEEYSSLDDYEDEIDTTKLKRIPEHAKSGNM